MRWAVLFLLMAVACTNKGERLDNMNHSQAAKTSFAFMDTDHDGFISHQEWLVQARKAAAIIPERNREQYITSLEQIFIQMDSNHDGNVSFAEASTNTAD